MLNLFIKSYLAIPIFLLSILLEPHSSAARQQSDETETRKIITLRKLGHQLLLSAGDRTTVVLPVQKTSNGGYALTFEKPFVLTPDSLADIVMRLRKDGELTGDYTLSVTREGDKAIVYGFTSNDLVKGTVPCKGRTLPARKYALHVQTANRAGMGFAGYALIFSGALSAAAGIWVVYRRRKSRNIPEAQPLPEKATDEDIVTIGGYTFSATTEVLRYGQEVVPLTAKETTLLKILLKYPNEVIERNLLLKLGWEDEGVITGRSLDMYISKLRKIFARDESISIKNIHGKGYSLRMTQSEQPAQVL